MGCWLLTTDYELQTSNVVNKQEFQGSWKKTLYKKKWGRNRNSAPFLKSNILWKTKTKVPLFFKFPIGLLRFWQLFLLSNEAFSPLNLGFWRDFIVDKISVESTPEDKYEVRGTKGIA